MGWTGWPRWSAGVRLLAAAAPVGDGDEPAPVDLDDLDADLPEVEARLAAELVAELAGGMGGQAQMLGQLTGPCAATAHQDRSPRAGTPAPSGM
jgi:hypothetical protein